MYTGNTLESCLVVLPISVYPCVYREHPLLAVILKIKNGLSLCIQGTRIDLAMTNAQNRFIPVYTGNTGEKLKKRAIKAVYPCVYREHVSR